MSISQLGALIYTKPEEVKRLVLQAIVDSEGDRKKAAEVLGTTHRTFYRFIERLRLWDDIDKLVEEHDFPRAVGPARSTEKIKAAFLVSRGSPERAAKHLGWDVATLHARIAELEMAKDLDALCKAEGWKCPPLARKT